MECETSAVTIIGNDMDYYIRLKECFPNQSDQNIQNVIDIVVEATEDLSLTDSLNHMMSMLTEDFNSGEVLHDEAVGGTSHANMSHIGNEGDILDNVLAVHKDVDVDYVQDLIANNLTYEEIMNFLSQDGCKPTSNKIDGLLSKLMGYLPLVDPSYLKQQAEILANKSEEQITIFINEMIERKEFPTVEEYNQREDKKRAIDKYTVKFNLETFLKEFPQPVQYFTKSGRKHSLTTKDPPDEEAYEQEVNYALTCLYNKYFYLKQIDIDSHMESYNNDVVKVCEKLDKMQKSRKYKRSKTCISEMPLNNILLHKELAFALKREEIETFLRNKELVYKRQVEDARRQNMLQTCENCYNDEVIPEHCCLCMGGCIFCRDCMKMGAETVIGEGKLSFPCFADCGSEFSMPTLQSVLDPVVYFRMEQRKQIQDIKAANIAGFETCPFCDFGTVPNEGDKIFTCENPKCLKQSCRECKHDAHIPLRCNEIEYDEDVRLRTFIENKMSEALLRVCKSCGTKIVKETGCNKMTCKCGVNMCYVCQASGIDYNHFKTGACDLHSDQKQLHIGDITNAITRAKRETGVDVNPAKLKIDPTADFTNFL